jgi:hypothetical protein
MKNENNVPIAIAGAYGIEIALALGLRTSACGGSFPFAA